MKPTGQGPQTSGPVWGADGANRSRGSVGGARGGGGREGIARRGEDRSGGGARDARSYQLYGSVPHSKGGFSAETVCFNYHY